MAYTSGRSDHLNRVSESAVIDVIMNTKPLFVRARLDRQDLRSEFFVGKIGAFLASGKFSVGDVFSLLAISLSLFLTFSDLSFSLSRQVQTFVGADQHPTTLTGVNEESTEFTIICTASL